MKNTGVRANQLNVATMTWSQKDLKSNRGLNFRSVKNFALTTTQHARASAILKLRTPSRKFLRKENPKFGNKIHRYSDFH